MIDDLTDARWDYRIFKQDFTIGSDSFSGFFIVEASYDKDVLTGVSPVDSPCAPYGMDLETLREEFRLMSLAFQSPVLTTKDLPENSHFIQRADGSDVEGEDDEST